MTDKRIQQLIDKISRIAENAGTETELLEAAASLIDGFSDNFNWTGFYMMKGDFLEVGPYIGPETPHTRIELNNGICGAAATSKRTIIVDDVHADPRFLACSLTTQSEIVIPLMDGQECLGEIDIDSNQPAAFSLQDKQMLEEIAAILVKRIKKLRSE